MASKIDQNVDEQEDMSDSDMEEFEDALEEIHPIADKQKQTSEKYVDDYMSSDDDIPDMEKIVEHNAGLNDSNDKNISETFNNLTVSEGESKDTPSTDIKQPINASPDSHDNTAGEEADETDDSDEDTKEPHEDIDVRKEKEDQMTEEEREVLKSAAQDLKTKGNQLFKEKNYEEALIQYTDGLHICPLCYARERSMLYSNRAACKLHLERYESAIEDSSKAVELNPRYLKALLRRAELYEKVDKLDEALGDYQRVLEMDPSQHSARQACMRLPDQIKERNEKMKEEMMGKLKELGNMVLKPFGLSTENFKLQQDPNSGSYSVNFEQKKS